MLAKLNGCFPPDPDPFNPGENVTIAGVGPNVSSQFNELKVSNRSPVIELTSTYGITTLRDIPRTVGTGTVTNNTIEYVLTTGTGATGSATLDTAERGRYQPGYAAESGIAVRLPANPTGTQVARWGIFGDQNGAFFGISGTTGLFVATRRDGVDTVYPQVTWNVDTLDGTGPSGLTLSISEGNIFQVQYSWYGYGVIEWSVIVQDPNTFAQVIVTVHRIKPVNQTSFADPNLPVRGQVMNNGQTTSFTMFVAGRQFSIVGEYSPTFRITSARRTVTATTTLAPVLSFQRKEIFPAGSGRPNSVNVTLQGVDIITGSDIFYQIVLGGTLNTAFTDFPTANTNIPANETALRINNTATSFTTMGQVVFQGLAPGGQGSTTTLTETSLLDLAVPDLQIITVAVGTFSGTTTAHVVFRLSEEW